MVCVSVLVCINKSCAIVSGHVTIVSDHVTTIHYHVTQGLLICDPRLQNTSHGYRTRCTTYN